MVQIEKSVVHDVRVESIKRLDPPSAYWKRYPLPDPIREQIARHRRQIEAILNGRDTRLLIIVGPCSIHDTELGLDYARRLAGLAKEVEDRLMIAMRVYFEKPRTTVGWKGLINDPQLNDTYDVQEGLAKARQFLIDVCSQGLPTATEFLEPFTPQYLSDMISWGAIGARTTESQPHRLMASGLSMPIGFKNGTGGGVEIAVDGVVSAMSEHVFLGIDADGSRFRRQDHRQSCGPFDTPGRKDGPQLRRGVGGNRAGVTPEARPFLQPARGLLPRQLEQGPQVAGLRLQRTPRSKGEQSGDCRPYARKQHQRGKPVLGRSFKARIRRFDHGCLHRVGGNRGNHPVRPCAYGELGISPFLSNAISPDSSPLPGTGPLDSKP